MSKRICQLSRDIKYHSQELVQNLMAISNNKRELLKYIGKPKYDVIMQALPIFEQRANEHKEMIEIYSKELSKLTFSITDDYDEWWS